MAWADFETDIALERDLLVRALPLVPTTSDGSSTAVVDMAANTAHVGIRVQEVLGPNPAGCVELLRIRPLLAGAAWKVIDLLLEHALAEAGFPPDQMTRWSIKAKVAHAAAGNARPSAIEVGTWRALTNTYVATCEIRHSLVHRRVHTDSANALVGVDDSGSPLRPLSATEQEALARAAIRATQLVAEPKPDHRVSADLTRQLGLLRGVHGESLPPVTLDESLPEVTAILDPEPSGGYRFDVPALRRRQPFRAAAYADLIVQFRDRPGQFLRGRLEAAPDEVVILDPDHPPDWLV